MEEISVLVFDSYKYIKDIPKELLDFNRINIIEPTNVAWRKQEKQNNWLVESRSKQTDDEKLYKDVIMIMNKLTETNFRLMTDDFGKLNVTKKKQLEKIGEIIFTKMITDSKFLGLYVKLFKIIKSLSIDNTNIRDIILTLCQEKYNLFINGKQILKLDIDGCMKFITHLYINNELPETFMDDRLVEILQKIGKVENSIEIIVNMITMLVVNKKQTNKLKEIIENLKKEQYNTNLTRERFKIMDMVDLINKMQ